MVDGTVFVIFKSSWVWAEQGKECLWQFWAFGRYWWGLLKDKASNSLQVSRKLRLESFFVQASCQQEQGMAAKVRWSCEEQGSFYKGCEEQGSRKMTSSVSRLNQAGVCLVLWSVEVLSLPRQGSPLYPSLPGGKASFLSKASSRIQYAVAVSW